MIEDALAGHAGESGSPLLLPHELFGAIVMLVILGVVLLVLTLVIIRRLHRLERRLRMMEETPAQSRPNAAPRL